ncbi:MAG: winged helix-turn-helix domain-containing protein, partial [Candidatus Bathyarchaeia archaeon]
MPDPQEEAYSSIFSALKHLIRRKILRMLREGPRSFSEMLEAFRIESPNLTYHLEAPWRPPSQDEGRQIWAVHL